jgi:hypothetical protein
VGGSGGFQVSSTNFLANTFANPLYYGRPGATSISMGVAGQRLAGAGFGQPSYGSVTTTTVNTGLAGRTGTATIGSNRGMSGGLGGTSNMPAISYAATVRFAPPAGLAPTVRADLQEMFDRSGVIRRPASIRVEAEGDVIVLRGKVQSADDKVLAEGMVRLEPGVHEVRNELEIGP